MSDLAGIFGAIGKGISTTARTSIELKELERRAQEDAKRLQLSMDSLELNKKRFEFQQATAAEDQAYRTRQAQAAKLGAALDYEADTLSAAKKTQDAKDLAAALRAHQIDLKNLESANRIREARAKAAATAKGKVTPKYTLPPKIETSTINKAMGVAQGRTEFGKDYGTSYETAVSRVKGTLNPFHMGGLGPRATGSTAKKKGKKVTKAPPVWDADSQRELEQLEKELFPKER